MERGSMSVDINDLKNRIRDIKDFANEILDMADELWDDYIEAKDEAENLKLRQRVGHKCRERPRLTFWG
jgi:hypothetical protein